MTSHVDWPIFEMRWLRTWCKSHAVSSSVSGIHANSVIKILRWTNNNNNNSQMYTAPFAIRFRGVTLREGCVTMADNVLRNALWALFAVVKLTDMSHDSDTRPALKNTSHRFIQWRHCSLPTQTGVCYSDVTATINTLLHIYGPYQSNGHIVLLNVPDECVGVTYKMLTKRATKQSCESARWSRDFRGLRCSKRTTASRSLLQSIRYFRLARGKHVAWACNGR